MEYKPKNYHIELSEQMNINIKKISRRIGKKIPVKRILEYLLELEDIETMLELRLDICKLQDENAKLKKDITDKTASLQSWSEEIKRQSEQLQKQKQKIKFVDIIVNTIESDMDVKLTPYNTFQTIHNIIETGLQEYNRSKYNLQGVII